MKKLTCFVAVGLAFLMCACSHPLRITNEKNFTASDITLSKPTKIGFLSTQDKLLNSVIEEIDFSPTITMVKKNYQINKDIVSRNDVDYVCELSQNMKFSASGQNFIITFPGFIVFTHAWLGYKYTIEIDTQSKVLETSGNTLSEANIITPYEIRHTSFARGAASSLIGWCTPGLGILDIIPGAIFASSYDKRATSDFIEKAKPSYKAFVSSKVLEQIAAVQVDKISGNNIQFRMKPFAIDDGISENTFSNANDHSFITYVMKVDSEQMISQVNRRSELSDKTLTLLNNSTFGLEVNI